MINGVVGCPTGIRRASRFVPPSDRIDAPLLTIKRSKYHGEYSHYSLIRFITDEASEAPTRWYTNHVVANKDVAAEGSQASTSHGPNKRNGVAGSSRKGKSEA